MGSSAAPIPHVDFKRTSRGLIIHMSEFKATKSAFVLLHFEFQFRVEDGPSRVNLIMIILK